MYSKIIQLRWLGIRRPENDITNDKGHFGYIQMIYSGTHARLNANRHGTTNADMNLLESLWDPICVDKGPYHERWRGYQRAKLPHGLGYTTVVQEWYIEHVAMRPPVE
jgi:hypothetical protein